jgi:hypothetical protein
MAGSYTTEPLKGILPPYHRVGQEWKKYTPDSVCLFIITRVEGDKVCGLAVIHPLVHGVVAREEAVHSGFSLLSQWRLVG